MNKIYTLNNDKENYSSFIEETNSVRFLDINDHWDNPKITDYKFELYGYAKKNYKFDISKRLNFVIFSDKAVKVLKHILTESGTFVPITTTSKRKKFYGFFPHKKIYNENIINFKKSDYSYCNNTISFHNIVLNHLAPLDKYIFVLDSNLSRFDMFVGDEFKKIVEDNNLLGFDFSQVVYDSERDPYLEFKTIQSNLDKELIIRDVFNYRGKKEDFASIIPDKEIAHEYPSIWLDQKYKNYSSDEYKNLCLNDKYVDEYAFQLLIYYRWCIDQGIRNKWQYLKYIPPQTFEKRNYPQDEFDNILKKYDLYPNGY